MPTTNIYSRVKRIVTLNDDDITALQALSVTSEEDLKFLEFVDFPTVINIVKRRKLALVVDYLRKGYVLDEMTQIDAIQTALQNNNQDSSSISHISGLNDDLLGIILSHLDVITLSPKKAVCKRWEKICTLVVDRKAPSPITPFQSKSELKKALLVYTQDKNKRGYKERVLIEAEEVASVYGWPIGKWDTSNVTDMSELFASASSFNEDISSLDTSEVTDMSYLFFNAASFNRSISSWDTSKVTTMSRMFRGATVFNQDISSWDTGNVEDMGWMFYFAESFKQDISSWDCSSVHDMRWRFY